MPRIGKGPSDRRASAFLVACRETLTLSQTELGLLVGVSQQQISKYENNMSSVPREILEKVGALAGMGFEEFGQPELPSPFERSGFEAKSQVPYTAQSTPEIADDLAIRQKRGMFLDLGKLHDPMDRKSLQAQYAKMLRKQGKE